MLMTLLHTVQRATGVPEGGIEPPPFAYETNELTTCSTPACSLLSYKRADDGDRTRDLYHGKVALFQLSYIHIEHRMALRADDGSRTRDYCLEGNGFTVKLHPQELY